MAAFIFAGLLWDNPRNNWQSIALLPLNPLSTNMMQSDGGGGLTKTKHVVWQTHLCQLYKTKVPNFIIIAFCSEQCYSHDGFMNAWRWSPWASISLTASSPVLSVPNGTASFPAPTVSSPYPAFFSPDKSEVEPPSNFPRFWAQRLN